MNGMYLLACIVEIIHTHLVFSFLIGLDAVPMVLAMSTLAILSPGELPSFWTDHSRQFVHWAEQGVFEHKADLYGVGPLLARQRRRQLAEKNGTLAPELAIENQNIDSESDRTLAEEEAVIKQMDQKETPI